MADVEQWVNMDKDPKWVEDEVTGVERLGPLHFEVEFKNAKFSEFKIRIVPRGSQAKYSKKERGRNVNFKLRFGKGAATNLGKKLIKLENDVSLPAAGGNKFLVEAKYKNKVVESTIIVNSRRRLFYQSCVMNGITAGDLSGMETEYWAPKKYYVMLKKKADGTMPMMECLYRLANGTDNYIDFVKAAKPHWSLEDRMPYAFMLVWTNYIASQGELDVDQEMDITIPSKLWGWRWSGQTFTLTLGQYLWYGLDSTHDANYEWLDAIEVSFRDKAGVETRLNIPKAQAKVVDPKHFAYGGQFNIEVDVSAADLAGLRNRFTKNEGKIVFHLRCRTVVGWTNGFSFNGINMITVADKAQWKDSTDAVKKYTLNHEFGHKIGMVADGNGRAPDKPAKHYNHNGGGHVGNHCETGATYDAATNSWSGAPGCVMFGADGTINAGVYAAAPPTYCGECEPAVRKLDLSAGMPGFANTPNNF